MPERAPGMPGASGMSDMPGAPGMPGMHDAAPSEMRSFLGRHRALCFLVVTYAITWGAWIPRAVAGHSAAAGFAPTYLIGLLGPLVGAFATTAVVDGRRGVRELAARMVRVRVGLRWWGIGLALPVGVAAATGAVLTAYAMFLLAPIHVPSLATLGRFDGYPTTNVVATWALLVAVNGFGEETGWRGVLLPTLLRRRSPLTASLVVGVCWAIWHVPALWVSDTYRALPSAMLPVFFVGIVSGSVFLAWLYNRGRRSILLVAVWHGTFNLLTGSAGARGVLAAVETATVIAIAAALVVQELRAGRREHTGRRAHHVMTPEPLATPR